MKEGQEVKKEKKSGLLREQSFSGKILRTLLLSPFLIYLIYISFMVYPWVRSIIDFKLNGGAQVLTQLRNLELKIQESNVESFQDWKFAFFRFEKPGDKLKRLDYYWGDDAVKNVSRVKKDIGGLTKHNDKWAVLIIFYDKEGKEALILEKKILRQLKVDLDRRIWNFTNELSFFIIDSRGYYERHFYKDNILAITLYWFCIGALLILWFYALIIATIPPSPFIFVVVILIPLFFLFVIWRYIRFGRLWGAKISSGKNSSCSDSLVSFSQLSAIELMRG